MNERQQAIKALQQASESLVKARRALATKEAPASGNVITRIAELQVEVTAVISTLITLGE